MSKRKRFTTLFLLLTCECFGQRVYNYPETFKQNVVDTIWSKVVNDPYRWLENINSDTTNEWLKAQEKVKNKCEGISYYSLLKYLPYYSHIDFKPIYKAGKYFFSYRFDDPDKPASLYYKKNEKEESKFLFNPAHLDKSATLSIDDYSLSDDNNTLALILTKNAGDWKTIRFLNMENKKLLDDTIDFVKYSSIYWFGNKVYYVRYAVKQTSESFTGLIKGRALFCHKLGTPQRDDKLIYQPENEFAVFGFEITPEKKYLILYHEKEINNSKYHFVSYHLLSDTTHTEFKDFIISKKEDEDYHVLGEVNGKLLVASKLNAPNGAFYRYNPGEVNQGEIFIPQFAEQVEYSKIIGNKILAIYNDNKQLFTVIYDSAGRQLNSFYFPEGNYVSSFSGSVNDSTAYFYLYSFFDPPSIFKINLNTYQTEQLDITYIHFDNTGLTTEKVYYYSKDSTAIPMYITHKKNLKLDGNNPTILYGYGGFGISMKPFFSVPNIIFFNNGGVLAAPCLRVGGDFPGWHEKGKRLNKQNTFDDFIYAAQYLMTAKYTNASKIAAMGGSNGGMVVGACMLQRPDLFKVVVSRSGVFDMLRHHLYNVGYSMVSEFGNIADSLDFKNLVNYSPVHNVKTGTDYPATLLVASDNDDRVLPFHSFKFLSQLQANGSSKNPYVLYYQHKAGHSGSDVYRARIEEEAYVYSFIFKYLGIERRIRYE